MLPGWHSDPSCIFVPEHDNTFFCATSSFLAFPGTPIFASKDLQNWKLISNTLNRPSQLPSLATLAGQSDGTWAPTLRYHDGTFFVVIVSVSVLSAAPWVDVQGLIFNTSDPYNDAAWSDPLLFKPSDIDPDIFWDTDGKVYITWAGIHQSTIDLTTGELGTAYSIWNGTGGENPEGPHIYKKDDYYYLLIAEGGTELNHSATIARSRNISGPYESSPGNPFLTNQGTNQYFQTVGHADLLQDASSNWWGIALATRSGPAWVNYPMGRETVLYPVTWNEGQWPIAQPVRGRMSGWPLPSPTRSIKGDGAFIEDPDVFNFEPGSCMPKHFVHWRFPADGSYIISPHGHPNTLRLLPSKANLTGTMADPTDSFTFISRRQTDTLFLYSIDVSFNPSKPEEETGVTVFLTQYQHIDLGIVLLQGKTGSRSLEPHFRFRTIRYCGICGTTGSGNSNGTLPAESIVPVPQDWLKKPISLSVQAINETHYAFSAGTTCDGRRSMILGFAPATAVSGGTGPFTGKRYETKRPRNLGETTDLIA